MMSMTISDGGDMYILDDFPTSGPHFDDLSITDKALIGNIHSRASVTIRDMGIYVYYRNVASWAQIQSSTACHELADLAGIDAPVNYMKALSRIMPMVQRLATRVGRIDRSVCINTYRLVPTIEYAEGGPIVTYQVHDPIIEQYRGPDYIRQTMFVVTPLVLPSPSHIYFKTAVDLDNEVVNDILYPLRDDQKLDFLWRMGNMLLDPPKTPCTILMYGRWGTEGKSAMTLNMTRLFRNVSMWSPVPLTGEKAEWPDAVTLMEMASKRLIIDDESDTSVDVNTTNIKKFNSGSPVEMGGSSFMLNQTIIGITNKLGFYRKESITRSMGRRFVIYRMDKDLQNAKEFDESRINNHIIHQFTALCLATALRFERSPMTLEIALYTAFRRSVNWITAGLINDEDASPDLAKEATAMMASRSGTDIKRLTSCFAAMSPDLVSRVPGECSYIKGIRTLVYRVPSDVQMSSDYISDTPIEFSKWLNNIKTF